MQTLKRQANMYPSIYKIDEEATRKRKMTKKWLAAAAGGLQLKKLSN